MRDSCVTVSRPRVAQVKTPFLPMTETFIYQYISHLRRYEPVVITEYLLNQDQFPVKNSVVHRRSGLWYEKGLTHFRNWLVSRIPQELFMTSFYRRALSKSDVSLIHFHFGVTGMLLTPVKKRLGIPGVVSFYGHDLQQVPYALGQDIYVRTGLFDAMELFVVEGSHAGETLVKLGCPREKVSIVHIGVDGDQFPFRVRKICSGDRPKILFCGRFVPKKGLLICLKALEQVRNRGRKFEFIIIGYGPEERQARRFTIDAKLEGCVRFLGKVKYQELQEWYGKCHILVAPSMTVESTKETEGGAPTVLLEAQATGLPVISTFHADIPEVVRDGETGLLVQEGAVDDLAEKITWLVDNPQVWPKMGRKGRSHIKREYEILRQAECLEQVYDRLLL